MTDHPNLPSKPWGLRLLAIVLWAATSALGFLEIVIVREIVLRIYVHFTGASGHYSIGYWGGHALGSVTVLIMGVATIALVIGGGEHHVRHFGTPKSWELFRRTIAVELSILVLAWFV
jgi:hypothetical protein